MTQSNHDRNKESQTVALAIANLLSDEKRLALLCRIAARHAWLPRGSHHARELVDDTIADMATEQLEPSEHTPFVQVAREVRRRAQRYQGAKERSIVVPLDDAPALALADPNARLPHLGDVKIVARDAPAVVAAIRALAEDDPAVLQLVELFVEGRVHRRDARAAGMPLDVYRGARERFADFAIKAVEMAQAQRAAAAAAAVALTSAPTVRDAEHRRARLTRGARRMRRLRRVLRSA